MKRPTRHKDGRYHINGKTYPQLFGSRRQVWNRTAYKTAGLLTRSDLFLNDRKRIVSVKKHRTASKERRLEKYGYYTEKNKFGAVFRPGTNSTARAAKRTKRTKRRKSSTAKCKLVCEVPK